METKKIILMVISVFALRYFYAIIYGEMRAAASQAQNTPLSPQEKQALLMVKTTSDQISSLNRTINDALIKIPAIKTLQDNSAAKKKEIANQLSRLSGGRSEELENTIAKENEKLDKIAAQAYARVVNLAQTTGQPNLYDVINQILRQDIYDNPEVNAKIAAIIRLIVQINDTIRASIARIHQSGRAIYAAIQPEQQEINRQQTQIGALHNELDELRHRQDIAAIIDPLSLELINLENSIELAVSKLSIEQQNELQRIKNVKERLELFLSFLRNPISIQKVTTQQLIGINF